VARMAHEVGLAAGPMKKESFPTEVLVRVQGLDTTASADTYLCLTHHDSARIRSLLAEWLGSAYKPSCISSDLVLRRRSRSPRRCW
jgi:hypothetical protein